MIKLFDENGDFTEAIDPLLRMARAVDFIQEGKLVAFPTETVYGLGADAFNSEAVAKVYSAKGRPSDNPLILHIAEKEKFAELAFNPPEYAFKLIDAFWAGPLTLVARKNPDLPSWLGGHPNGITETVGIRMPSHPVAQAFIKASGCVVAAPSANKAGKPSPTTIEHVISDFPELLNSSGKSIERLEGLALLNGGSSDVGLESTVVDITEEVPRILRAGSITAEQIREVTGLPVEGGVAKSLVDNSTVNGQLEAANPAPRSPGMKYKHYAPNAPMTIVSGSRDNVVAFILDECIKAQERNIGVLLHVDTVAAIFNLQDPPPNAFVIPMGHDDESIAQGLFARLRECDEENVDVIYIEAVPETGIGVAIMDRMLKAAEGRVVYV